MKKGRLYALPASGREDEIHLLASTFLYWSLKCASDSRKFEGEFFPKEKVFFVTKNRKCLSGCTFPFATILTKPKITTIIQGVQHESCRLSTSHSSKKKEHQKQKKNFGCVLHENLLSFTFVSTFAPREVWETGCGLLLVPREIQLETQCLLFNIPDNMPRALRRPFLLTRKWCCSLVSVLRMAAELVSSRVFGMCTRWGLQWKKLYVVFDRE